MCEKLQMIEGHWYWTKSGHRAIMFFEDDGRWFGVAFTGKWTQHHKWDVNGVAEGDSDFTLVAHHGPEMPTTETRPEPEPEWLPWDEFQNLIGLPIKMKEDKKYTAMIGSQGEGSVYVVPLGWMTYEELLQDWTHELGGDDIPCGRRVDRSVKHV